MDSCVRGFTARRYGQSLSYLELVGVAYVVRPRDNLPLVGRAEMLLGYARERIAFLNGVLAALAGEVRVSPRLRHFLFRGVLFVFALSVNYAYSAERKSRQ